MLTDKQSIILCAIVVGGFSLFGVFNLLSNYAVSGVLLVLFLWVVINLIFNKTPADQDVKKK